MEIKDIIKTRRKELGLTQRQVADRVGVSEATVSRWESGEIGEMIRSNIYMLAKTLKLSPLVLMGDMGEGAILTLHEINVVEAYRAHPEMQAAIDRILKVERR